MVNVVKRGGALKITQDCKDCDDVIITALFENDNRHAVAKKRGRDLYFLTLYANELPVSHDLYKIRSRYILVGDANYLVELWSKYHHDITIGTHRAEVAGAEVIYLENENHWLTKTPEFIVARTEGRVIIVPDKESPLP